MNDRRPPVRLSPFSRVLDEHGPLVLRFCRARVGAELAEDCFQQTMLAALRGYADLRDPGAVRGWLLTVAARTAVDLHRARARAPEPVAAPEPPAAHEDAELPDDDLWARVAALPDRQREALVLRIVGDLSHREVAAAAGTSEEAARRNVHEALRRLRREVRAREPGPRAHDRPPGGVPAGRDHERASSEAAAGRRRPAAGRRRPRPGPHEPPPPTVPRT